MSGMKFKKMGPKQVLVQGAISSPPKKLRNPLAGQMVYVNNRDEFSTSVVD
tara:strand:- start:450 stop:602 length:153 start_codon:yes stop_codon:yes gene_type:complete